ncbi:related to Ubiquitin fusion degradation protein 4 [Zygosaccharomyces bailii]|nr:related to Ubiquitin fusion degradation protein 4 [Zygosaccharomyces bailii]
MDENDHPSGSSDYMVDEQSSADGQDEYEYPDATSSERGYDESSGQFHDAQDEEQDMFIGYDGAEEGDEDHAVEDENSSATSFTVQDILGNLAQTMEGHSQGVERSGPFANNRETGPMNLAGVFPEILSILNDGMQQRGSGGGRNDRISKLVKNVLNADEDPYIAMESLRELSEHLLMTNQVVVDRIFPIEKLLSGILNVLSNPMLKGELELQLISCRCLYNLFEVNPKSITMAVEENAVHVLQEILQEISYIDLAEQVLETLELISRLHGREVLKSGALASCLQYLDFFTIHAQRKAVSIVANSCTRVRMESFGIVQTLFVLLKPIFVNATDQVIISRLLNSLYGVCGGLREADMLESLFTFEVVERLLQLVSIPDTPLEDRIKCLDILSVLLNVSGKISKEMLVTCDLTRTFSDCLECYGKATNSALHETLMFVPKPLLHAIARTVALLFPTETEQLLSVDPPKEIDLSNNSEKMTKTLTNFAILLIEIFVNTVEFDVRRCVLIALARIVPFLKRSMTGQLGSHIIRLVGSTLAQNEAALNRENEQIIVSGGLLIGVLSLLDILTARFASDFLPAIRREGIVDLVDRLYGILNRMKDEGKFVIEECNVSLLAGDGGSVSESGEVMEEEEDDDDEEYGAQFGDIDIPDQVKPKQIKFEVLRPLNSNYIYMKAYDLSKNLTQLFSHNEGVVIEELKEIEKLVLDLNELDAKDFSEESWSRLWTRVRDNIFNGNFEISSFELISSGLAAKLSQLVDHYSCSSFIPERTFIRVFGDHLSKLVEILQSALTRLESFHIMECGLQGEEGGVASLGKQMKIRLIYDGDAQEDSIAPHLTTITLSIHCVASLKTLSEFLKHRIAQTRFLNSLLPGLTFSSANTSQNNADDLNHWEFEFSTEEGVLNPSDTIFGAVFKSVRASHKELSEIWRTVQVIKFKRVNDQNISEEPKLFNLYTQHNFGKDVLKPAEDILSLLKFARASDLPSDLFVNAKLSAKLSRQLEEPLIVAGGVLPDWSLYLTKNCPFLFPFETRIFFLQCTSFGYGRLIQIWRKHMGKGKETMADDPLQQLGRVTRHKLRISRNTMFLSGLKILNKYGSSPSVLEIEYQDEVGTGLGPTLEFYATMSQGFSKKSLGMWRYDAYGSGQLDAEGNSPYVNGLLFPAPLTSTQNEVKILELFHYLGTFVARSMLDTRILDLNINKIFFELAHRICNRHGVPNKEMDEQDMLRLLSFVDPQLARSLRALYTEADLESLTLNFTLPGYDIELVHEGKSLLVSSNNLNQYVKRVLDYTLGTGIEKQLTSFIDGFSTVLPYSSLLLLTPEELVHMCGRTMEDWSSETLYASLVADHGYSMDSSTIHDLIYVMSTFNDREKRLFLQFLTGSPKLPIGGFKALNPKLTVVLKHPEDGLQADEYLPSVMTCANYFKLPKYSSQTVMRSRILQAMQEGSGAFLLS